MIKCPSCGAEIEFDPTSQQVVCSYCGCSFNPNELNEEVKVADKVEDSFEGQAYHCTQCGATLLTFDDTAITFCSYCGSQAMIEENMMKVNNPDFIIPFKKTKEECIAAYKRKIGKYFFIPSYMKSDVVIEKFRGIYMPYAMYTLECHEKASCDGTKYKCHRGNYDYYDDFSLTSPVEAKYEGLSQDLVSQFYDSYSSAIPFNSQEAVPFNANYLTGFYADTKDVESFKYNTSVIDIGVKDTTQRMSKDSTYRKYRATPKAPLKVTDTKVGLFPVYFLAVKDKTQKRVSYAVVNGQTGEVAVDVPISFSKYVIISLIVSAIIFAFINSFFVFKIQELLFLLTIAAIVGAIIGGSQFGKIKKKILFSEDKGVQNSKKMKDALNLKTGSANKKDGKTKKLKASKYIRKNIIAAIICILTILGKVIDDEIVYAVAIIAFILIVWSFYGLAKEHNELTTNPLPQLEKRGGDIDA